MIKHIVTFRLKGMSDNRKAKAESFKKALLALPDQIDCLKSIEVGINCNPEENWDIVLTAIFDNFDDLTTYTRHPLHVAAADIIKDCKEDRSCVDYIM